MLKIEKIFHIWDIELKIQKKYKMDHDKFVMRFKREFAGAMVSLGTYGFNGPSGAT